MIPLKQEMIDIMTWPTVECGCMCASLCVCLKIDIFFPHVTLLCVESMNCYVCMSTQQVIADAMERPESPH